MPTHCVSFAIVSAELVAIDGAREPVTARVSNPSATGPLGPCARKRPAWSWAASSPSTPALSAGLPRHASSRYASRSGPPGRSMASQTQLFRSVSGKDMGVDSSESARNDCKRLSNCTETRWLFPDCIQSEISPSESS